MNEKKKNLLRGALLLIISTIILCAGLIVYYADKSNSNTSTSQTGLINNGDKWNIDIKYIPDKTNTGDEVIQQIYEYSFTNSSSTSNLVVKLITLPTVENMTVSFAYSNTQVSDKTSLVGGEYDDKILSVGDTIYVYLIAQVSDTTQNASYSQSVKWQIGKPARLTFVFGYNIPNVSGYVIAGAPIPDIAIPEMPNNILGVQLVGWYSNSACTNEVSLSNPIRQDTTLYAKTTYVTTDWIFYDSTHSPKGYTVQAGTNPSVENLPTNLIIPPQYNDGTNGLGNIVKFNDNTFKEVTTLESVDVQAKVSRFGQSVFYGCTNLKSIKLQDNVSGVSFGPYLFRHCTSLTEITIPEGVESIQLYLLGDCTNLKKVTLPSTIKTVSTGSFYRCNALEEINLPEGLTTIGNYTFWYCSSLKNVVLPSTLTGTIGACAFGHCNAFTSINIPAGITNISSQAFDACSNLSSVTFDGNNVASFSNYCFRNCPIKTISLPSSCTQIGTGAFSYLTSLTIPANVTQIANSALGIYLTSVIFEDTTTWYVTDNSDYTGGAEISVTNATTNAKYLVSTYKTKYWYKV